MFVPQGVEVLLQLGANVNTGSGRESPLCYACQNNNEEMMVLILEQVIFEVFLVQVKRRFELDFTQPGVAKLYCQRKGEVAEP